MQASRTTKSVAIDAFREAVIKKYTRYLSIAKNADAVNVTPIEGNGRSCTTCFKVNVAIYPRASYMNTFLMYRNLLITAQSQKAKEGRPNAILPCHCFRSRDLNDGWFSLCTHFKQHFLGRQQSVIGHKKFCVCALLWPFRCRRHCIGHGSPQLKPALDNRIPNRSGAVL